MERKEQKPTRGAPEGARRATGGAPPAARGGRAATGPLAPARILE